MIRFGLRIATKVFGCIVIINGLHEMLLDVTRSFYLYDLLQLDGVHLKLGFLLSSLHHELEESARFLIDSLLYSSELRKL